MATFFVKNVDSIEKRKTLKISSNYSIRNFLNIVIHHIIFIANFAPLVISKLIQDTLWLTILLQNGKHILQISIKREKMSKVEYEIMNFLECYDFTPKKNEETKIIINLDPNNKICHFCDQRFIEADKNLLFYKIIYSYYQKNCYEYEDICVLCTCQYILDDLRKRHSRSQFHRYVSLYNENRYIHYDIVYHIYMFVQKPQNKLFH